MHMADCLQVSEDQEKIAATWPASAGSIEDACSAMLMFMKSNGIANSQKPQLRRLAFVPVANGTRLVPPTSLFARLKRDLAPFAYQLPFTFVAHSEVLVQIGMESQPKPDRLLQILQVEAAIYSLGLDMTCCVCAEKPAFGDCC